MDEVGHADRAKNLPLFSATDQDQDPQRRLGKLLARNAILGRLSVTTLALPIDKPAFPNESNLEYSLNLLVSFNNLQQEASLALPFVI